MDWRMNLLSLLFTGILLIPDCSSASSSAILRGMLSQQFCLGRKASGRRRDKEQVQTKFARRIWSPVGAANSAVGS